MKNGNSSGHWMMSACIKARIELVVQKGLIEARGASQKQIEAYFGFGRMESRMTSDYDKMISGDPDEPLPISSQQQLRTN